MGFMGGDVGAFWPHKSYFGQPLGEKLICQYILNHKVVVL
jgi:hypothetical protein